MLQGQPTLDKVYLKGSTTFHACIWSTGKRERRGARRSRPSGMALDTILERSKEYDFNLMRTLPILTFSIGALLAVSAPASARARDEAMLNAYRCAGIASTRTWLDCYYGAAQPVRAALGLLPAPAEQLRLGLSPPAGGGRQNQDLRDEVMASAGHCGSLADEQQWLGCYYAAAAPVRASLGLSVPTASPMGSAQIKSNRPSPRVPSRRPGAFAELLGAPDISIASRMVSYSFDRYGNFTVTLANGQVWRQVEGDTSTARWHKSASSYLVNITGGAFGSYNFTVNGNPSKFKVRRVSER